MKLSDYIVEFLADLGITHVFGLSGGAVVHLFDSAARSGKLQPVFTHHEQAAAFAAQSFARLSGGLGACFVTTGPGVTNAMTGLAAAWLDSVPCMFISGQTRLGHTTRHRRVRQIGTQALDVLDMVRPLTNYAVQIRDPMEIRDHLQRALVAATRGRPGPVWIDLPLDLQWAQIEPSSQLTHPASEAPLPSFTSLLDVLCEWIHRSERPLFLAGSGIRRAGAPGEFVDLINKTRIPFGTTWGAVDILPSRHPLCTGRPGIAGQRGGNLAVQNSDLLICLGTHLGVPVTGNLTEAFARDARIVMVDIDPDELSERSVRVDLPIRAHLRPFLRSLVEKVQAGDHLDRWRHFCGRYKLLNRIPPFIESGTLNGYSMVHLVSEHASEGDVVVVDGGGTSVYTTFQAFETRENQRMILSTSLCAMGSGLPESIGACFASNRKRTICFCGDGSLQLNIQELQTLKHHWLPIKIFVMDNDGYVSIRQTQNEFLEGRHVGSECEGGMSLPDFCAVAAAFGIPAERVDDFGSLEPTIVRALSSDGPFLCVVRSPPDQEIIPRQAFDRSPDGRFLSRPLEDMAPLMDRDLLDELLLVDPWRPGGG